MKKINFIDLFSGIGGIRIAFENDDTKCVFSSEIDKYASETYFNNFSEVPHGDITKIEAIDIPNHDILTAGFPCQAFSIGGKRLGFEDTRGTLFFEVARIINEKKPKAIFLENVRGITNHDGGNTLKIIKETIEELGYDYKYEILNARKYGIPQNRDRWYFVAFRKDLNINMEEFKFPKQKDLSFKIEDIIETNVGVEYNTSEIAQRNIDYFLNEKGIKNIEPYTLAYDIRPSRCLFRSDNISPCLVAKMGTGGNNVPVLVSEKRRLTEKECIRIMGFPEKFKIGKGSQAYKQIGNSVVVPIIKEIANEIISILKKLDN